MHRLSYPTGSTEPVSYTDTLATCGLDDDAATALAPDIRTTIEAARAAAEHITGRWYRRQVQREPLADWPQGRIVVLPLYQPDGVAISYRSAADPDTWTVLDPALYRWSAFGFDTRIQLRATTLAWPDLAPEEYGERVRFDITVGPTDPATVPACVKRYIMASVSAWVEQRSAQTMGKAVTVSPLFERLLDAERLYA